MQQHKANDVQTLWHGCYNGGRGDLFTPESNRHPAKMAVALCYRIFEHGRQRGYWKPGDLIFDPMAGIGTTLVCGATLGYRVLGIELEAHFIELAWDNILLCAQRVPGSRRNYLPTRKVPPFGIVQSDARKLSAILGAAEGAITSPPYADCPGTPSLGSVNKDDWGKEGRDIVGRRGLGRGYSGAISSPPYSETHVGNPGEQELASKGQARLIGTAATGHGGKGRHRFQYSHEENAQIGNLRDPRDDIDAVLTSPPYGDVMSTAEARGKPSSGWIEDKGIPHNKYGNEEAQIGNKNAETYLSAMLAVYRELHAVLKPGGVVCLVTKNPVKAGKIRRLDEDTIRLMEAAGFELIERAQAMLAEDLGAQLTLDGGSIPIRRERKSFFKRLFERKRPDLKVDHEDVLFFKKDVQEERDLAAAHR